MVTRDHAHVFAAAGALVVAVLVSCALVLATHRHLATETPEAAAIDEREHRQALELARARCGP